MEPNPRRTPFSDAELDEFRDLITTKRTRALAEIETMRARLRHARESGGDTAFSLHMADAGTDTADREQTHAMIARQQTFVSHLDRALQRIGHKTYGVCRVSGEPIARDRLLAVPHTETSIAAKRDEQKRR